MDVERIEFPSERVLLRGRLFRTGGAEPGPCVVMAHGTSATTTMVAEDYAAAFARAGMNVLLYDHINFGLSGGTERQLINPWLQGRGYRDAVRYVAGLSFVDEARIALWGDSYSAMEVLVVGGLIGDLPAGLAGIVAQIPACGIALPEVAPGDAAFDTLKTVFANADIAALGGDSTGPVPVVSPDQLGTPSLLKPIQAFRWFMEFGGRFGSLWENRATRVIPAAPVPFSPLITAPRIGAPVLFITGRDDEMVHCNREVQMAVFDALAGPKKHLEIDGGHFGLLYPGSAEFQASVTAQTTFLREVLRIA